MENEIREALGDCHWHDAESGPKAIKALEALIANKQKEAIGEDETYRRNYTIKRVMDIRNNLRAEQRAKLKTLSSEGKDE